MDDEDKTREDDLLIISDPDFMDGNPIINGTRVTVEQLLLELAKGLSVEHILEEHSELTPKTVKAALEFAAESVRFDHVNPS